MIRERIHNHQFGAGWRLGTFGQAEYVEVFDNGFVLHCSKYGRIIWSKYIA